ncbi:RNA dependent RNA polymerase-domain-containing protein [Daldinia vernicosa]|uniref:RNA dependent RNA polymerase-domain-containing protein n=1 Tax=Daldinia vernicosa TaxID=114800 RepID=UPI0020076D1F|nr:RNA dependent RNA polymerase-domain-containing protein [Daldinia vernicosa]KAI0848410.1 RNA dependent RNA polymerase-domain-containing protein [Daldinia vernicosa]
MGPVPNERGPTRRITTRGPPKRTVTLFDSKTPTPQYASLDEMEDALKEIRRELTKSGEEEDIISTDPEDLLAHGYSEWSTTNPDGLPVAVVYPRSTDQVSIIARVCYKYRVPIIPYSGGSSLEGNFSAPFGGISVDFAYMDQIIQFNKDDMDIVVQPSIGWQDLNDQLSRMGSGLFFPIDPGPSAKIGGMIGTNCSGTNAVKYGTMKDWVINLTVVLADGTVIKTRRRPRKSSAGYNLNGLFVGSEGTLGLVTEATLKLAVVPEEFSVAVVTFPTIRDAASAAAEVMQTGVPIAAMEIMDEVQMKVVNLGGATAPRVWKEEPTLFFKFAGTKTSVKENITRVQAIAKNNKGSNFEFAKDLREQKLLWSARKESLWSMLALRKEGEEKEMDDLGLFASILGHIGDGNFHESIIYNRTKKEELDKVEKCVKNMVKRALDMEGTCTGEHSIGWGKKDSLLLEVGPDTLGVMKQIKSALDPLRWNNFAHPTYGSEVRRSSNIIGIKPQWSSWAEISLRIRGLPPATTTFDLWTHFKKDGEVVFIELFEKNDGTREGGGRIRFSPPPIRQFWDNVMVLSIQGQSVKVKVELEKERQERRIPGSNNRSYPPFLSIAMVALQFGVLAHEDEVMPMRTIQNNMRGQFSLGSDLNSKRLEITFACSITDPRREDPTQVPFINVKRIVFIDVDENTWALLIHLPSPPLFYRKCDYTNSHTSSKNIWKEQDAWNRIVDIAYDTSWFIDEPVLLSRTNRFINIGTWTTYRLLFAKSSLVAWEEMKAALQEFNIFIDHKNSNDIKIVPPLISSFWDALEPQQPGADTSKANFALLADMEDIYLPYDVRYQLEACISQGIFNEVNITTEFLRRLANLSRGRTRRRDRAKDLLTIYDPMSLFEDTKATSHYPEISLPRHCIWVRKVVITPTTIYLSSPAPEPSNRVLRQYINYEDRFIRVQFTDELIKGRIYSDPDTTRDNALFNRVYRVLQNGIQIGGRHFQYLATGNSQFREHGAYFFCPADFLTCDNIRAWMGDVNHIRVVAKYASRLGQCFSTTRIPKASPIGQAIIHINDIEHDGRCFTDGVGKIAFSRAKFLMQNLDMSRTSKTLPSVFQFRLGGSKGILVQWPDVPFNEVHLRPSQKKFNAVSKGLEIIKTSSFSVATLNRQTITILSCLGVPDEAFEEMMKKQIADYERAMTDAEFAMQILSRYVDQNGITTIMAQMIADGFMETKEPFFMTLLHIWRAWSMRLLREKARIMVDKGAFVFGCADETRTLRGHSNATDSSQSKDTNTLPQIFLQVPKTGVRPGEPGEYTVITGICVLGRNPSLHPGDIRVVEAVDVPALRHLRDVVVFPTVGDRDIPSMCSGGDLDGDDYFVIWDPRLIPTEWNHPPIEHDSLKPKELNRDVKVTDLISFFVSYMKNDSLSTIAHAHLAKCDALTDGPKHPQCIELAHLHSNAVDYPKTGQKAYLRASLRPKKYPHFMEKVPSRTYRSMKILGRLYDQVAQIEFKPELDSTFDQRILRRYSLKDELLKTVRMIKRQHDKAMRQIMNQYDIETEFEAWSTFMMSKPRLGGEYKRQENMEPVMTNHRERFRDVCIKLAGSRDPDVLYPVVAATYRITWEEVQITLGRGRASEAVGEEKSRTDAMPLISFPWVFEYELGRIAMAKDEFELEEVPQPTTALLDDDYTGDDDEFKRIIGISINDSEEIDGFRDLYIEVVEEQSTTYEELVELEEDEDTGMDALARLAD